MPPARAANLVANSDNTAYVVEIILKLVLVIGGWGIHLLILTHFW